MQFIIEDIHDESKKVFESLEEVPSKHKWAFQHIQEQDCDSISCGSTVYSIEK